LKLKILTTFGRWAARADLRSPELRLHEHCVISRARCGTMSPDPPEPSRAAHALQRPAWEIGTRGSEIGMRGADAASRFLESERTHPFRTVLHTTAQTAGNF
jgi:hypothetical protein